MSGSTSWPCECVDCLLSERARRCAAKVDSSSRWPVVFLCLLESLLNVDGQLSTNTGADVVRLVTSRAQVLLSRALQGTGHACVCCVRFFFLFLAAHVDDVCALLGAVCAARRCVCSALCMRLALYPVFFVPHSETRMYFSAVQIAAYFCWLVAVSAQVTMNAADAAALNQTLTGLGCWQSSKCMTLNFNCSSTGVVRCNANGSVTYL